MNRIRYLICILLLALTGCVYSNIKTPLDIDLNRTTLGPKVGKSHMQGILWLVAWGDSGTEAAARDGGITVINHMDQRTLVILFGVYSKRETIVYGD